MSFSINLKSATGELQLCEVSDWRNTRCFLLALGILKIGVLGERSATNQIQPEQEADERVPEIKASKHSFAQLADCSPTHLERSEFLHCRGSPWGSHVGGLAVEFAWELGPVIVVHPCSTPEARWFSDSQKE